MAEPHLLPKVTNPLEGESVISWLLASADRVLYSIEDFLEHVRIPTSVTRRDLLLRLQPEWITNLAAATGSDEAAIEKTTLHGLANPLQAHARSAAPLGLGGAVIARCCPDCLRRSGGRWPLRWHTPWAFYCRVDNRFLETRQQIVVPVHWRLNDDLEDVKLETPAPVTSSSSAIASDAQAWLDDHLATQDPSDVVVALHLLTARLIRSDCSTVAADMGEPFVTAVRAAQEADHGPGRGNRRQGRVALTYQIPTQVLAVAAEWTRRLFDAPSSESATAVIATELEAEMRDVPASPHDRLKKWGGASATLTAAALPLLKGATATVQVALQFRLGTASARQPTLTHADVLERARKVPTALWPAPTAELWRPEFGPLNLFRRACTAALLHVGARNMNGDIAAQLLGPGDVIRAFQKLNDAQRIAVQTALVALSGELDRYPVVIDYTRRRALPIDDLLPACDWNAICEISGYRTNDKKHTAARALLHYLMVGDALSGLPSGASELHRTLPRQTFELLTEYGERWLNLHGIVEPLTDGGPGAYPTGYAFEETHRRADSEALRLELDPTLRSEAPPQRRKPVSSETLTVLYVDRHLTTFEIADLFDVSPPSVQRWLAEASIPRRPRGSGSRPRPSDKLPVGDLPHLRAALTSDYALTRLDRIAAAVTFPTMGAAAQALGLHGTSLQLQLDLLERDVGVQLLQRAVRNQPQRLTPTGQQLLDELDTLRMRLAVDG